MNTHNNVIFFRRTFIFFGVLTFLSLFLYGVGSLEQMGRVAPDGFIPKSLESNGDSAFWLSLLSPLSVLLYALSFLPVVVMFTIARFKVNPFAMVLAACLLVLSFFIEIVNSLPLVSLRLAHLKIPDVPYSLMLYLSQLDAARFLALDVAGFTLAYAGLFIYAIVFFKTDRWMSWLILGSIVLFISNVPFLWIMPAMAVILMAASILAFALIPLFMIRTTLNSPVLFLNRIS